MYIGSVTEITWDYQPNKHIVGNIVKMSAILQPWTSRTYVISRTLSFHLAQSINQSINQAAGVVVTSRDHIHQVEARVGFLPWQKVFLSGQWKKPVKTTVKTGKNWQKV